MNEDTTTQLTKDIEQALAEPFDKREEKTLDKGYGGTITYVDARCVMNRLDEVVGASGWRDDYALIFAGEPGIRHHFKVNRKTGERYDERDIPGQVVAVECRLTVLGVTKVDVGQADEETEGFKASYSDAFKRAAVKFGIGRYLYDDKPGDRSTTPQSRQNANPGAERSVPSNATQQSGAATQTSTTPAESGSMPMSEGNGDRAALQAYLKDHPLSKADLKVALESGEKDPLAFATQIGYGKALEKIRDYVNFIEMNQAEPVGA